MLRRPLRRAALPALFAALLVGAPPAEADIDHGVSATTRISSGDLDRMRRVGVDVLRVRLDRATIRRPHKRGYDWSASDRLIVAAARRGVEVQPYLSGAPRCGCSHRRMQAWSRFVAAAVDRYGTGGSRWRDGTGAVLPPTPVTTWTLWSRLGSSGPTDPAIRADVAVLRETRRAARRSDRGAEVALGLRLGKASSRGRRGLTARLLRAAAEGSAPKPLSVVAVRPPGDTVRGLTRRMRQVRGALDRVGLQRARIIVGPVGWASESRRRGDRRVGLRRQSASLRRTFEILDRRSRRWGVDSVVWSAWRDGGRRCGTCRKSGLITRSGAAKPSLAAFAAIARAGGPPPGPPLPPLGPRFFGVVPNLEVTEEDIEGMARVGVGTMRVIISHRAHMPDDDGPFRWAGLDSRMTSLARAGITPQVTLFGDADEANWLTTAEGMVSWRRFVAAAVARYGENGTFWRSFAAEHPALSPRPPQEWEVWNEPNGVTFWWPEPTVEGYARLLAGSASAIRSRDPGAEVMIGGMYANSTIQAATFLQELYDIPGTRGDFDLVALHPYAGGNAGIASQVETVREIMEANGDAAKDIWVTELGWSSVPNRDPRHAHFTRDEAGQAASLDEAVRMLIANRARWRLRGFVWYSWRDADRASCFFCQHTGLLRNDGSAKPALARFAAIANDYGR